MVPKPGAGHEERPAQEWATTTTEIKKMKVGWLEGVQGTG